MKPELLEAKLLRLETFDALVEAEVMEKEIIPRQRIMHDAWADEMIRTKQQDRRVVHALRDRCDEEQLALIGKAKALRGKMVRVVIEKGYVVDLYKSDEN